MKANAYLNFNGNCRAAFEFYAKTLGGKDLQIMTFADSNPGPNAGFEPDELKLVMHARFMAGETRIMGRMRRADATASRKVSVFRSRSTHPGKPNVSTARSPRAAKFPCRCRRRSSRISSAC